MTCRDIYISLANDSPPFLAAVITANGLTLSPPVAVGPATIHQIPSLLFPRGEPVQDGEEPKWVRRPTPLATPPSLVDRRGAWQLLATAFVPPIRPVISFALRSVEAGKLADIWANTYQEVTQG